MLCKKQKIWNLLISFTIAFLLRGIQPVFAEENSIELSGILRYNGQLMPDITDVTPTFWCRNESTGQTVTGITTTYNKITGAYSIAGLPLDRVGIQVRFHILGERPTLPGNYVVFKIADIPQLSPDERASFDIDLQQIIHMTSPWDNGAIGPPTYPAAPYPQHSGCLHFAWDTVPGATQYQVCISIWRDSDHPDGSGFVEYVVYSYVQENSFSTVLFASNDFEHYQASIFAYDSSSSLLGHLEVNYENGYGWDYRFRVIPCSDIDADGIPDLYDVCPADPLNECNPDGSTAEEVDAEEGGAIETPDGDFTIDIDPYDMAEDTTISVTETVPVDSNVDLMIGSSPGLGVAIAVYDLEPDGIVFNSPVTITVTADVTNLNENQRDRLKLYLWDDNLDKFVPLEGAVCDVVEDPPGTFIETCTAELEHFSTVAMVAPLDSDNDGIPDLFGDEEDHCLDVAADESVLLSYTGDLLIAIDETGGATVRLAVIVINENDELLPEVLVSFSIRDIDGYFCGGCSARTDDQGVASCTLSGLEPDVYTVTVHSGESGCPVALTEALLVVFDPSVPRATGGGFIFPDAESTHPAETINDKANFGFIVQLDKNKAAAGNLEFQYKTAGINLKSQSMTWYTVSNNKAMFQGSGIINGAGLYTFRVYATDGDLTGDQPDRFDIRIWEGTDTEAELFHRAKNDLAGGNILIHKK